MFNKLRESVVKQTKPSDHSRVRTTSNASSGNSATCHTSPITEPDTSSTHHLPLTDSLLGDESDAASLASFCPSEPDKVDWQTRFHRVRQLAQTYKSKHQKISEAYAKLRAECDRHGALGNETSRQLDELRKQVDRHEQNQRDVEGMHKRALDEKNELIEALRVQLHDLSVNFQTASAQVAKLTAERDKLEQSVQKYEGLVTEMSTQQDRIRRDLADSRLAQSALEDQVTGLKSQLVDSMTDAQRITDLTNQVASLEERIAQHQAERDRLEQELTSYKESARLRQTTVASNACVPAVTMPASGHYERMPGQEFPALVDNIESSYGPDAIRLGELESELADLRAVRAERDRLITELESALQRNRESQQTLVRLVNASGLAPIEQSCSDPAVEEQLLSIVQEWRVQQSVGQQRAVTADIGLQSEVIPDQHTGMILDANSQLEVDDSHMESSDTVDATPHTQGAGVLSCMDLTNLHNKILVLRSCLPGMKLSLESNTASMRELITQEVALAAGALEAIQTRWDDLHQSQAQLAVLSQDLHAARAQLAEYQIAAANAVCPTEHVQSQCDHNGLVQQTDNIRDLHSKMVQLEQELSDAKYCAAQLQQTGNRFSTYVDHEFATWETRNHVVMDATNGRIASIEARLQSAIERLDLLGLSISSSLQNCVGQWDVVSKIGRLNSQLERMRASLASLEEANLNLTRDLDRRDAQITSMRSQLSASDETRASAIQSVSQAMIERVFAEFRKRAQRLTPTGLFPTTVDRVPPQLDQLMSEALRCPINSGAPVDCCELYELLDRVSNQLDCYELEVVREHESLRDQLKTTVDRLSGHLCLPVEQPPLDVCDETKRSTMLDRLQELVVILQDREAQSKAQLDEERATTEEQKRLWSERLASTEQRLNTAETKLKNSEVALCEKESQIIKLATQSSELTTLRTALANAFIQLRTILGDSARSRISLARELLQLLDPTAPSVGTLADELDALDRSFDCDTVDVITDLAVTTAEVDRLRELDRDLCSVSARIGHLHVDQEGRRVDDRTELAAAQQAVQDKVRLEDELRETRVELDTVRASLEDQVNHGRQLEVSTAERAKHLETTLADVQERLGQKEMALMEKSDLVLSLELQLQEFRQSHEASCLALTEKEKQVDNFKSDIANWETRFNNSQLDVDRLQSACAELEDRLLQSTRATEQQLEHMRAEHDSRVTALESASQQREKQLKQQLRDCKARLKQLLLDLESQRKDTQSAVSREQQVTSLLNQSQTDLDCARNECDQLRAQADQLRRDLVEMQQAEQLKQSQVDAAQFESIDRLRETYQNDMDSAKAEYTLRIREMQAQFDRQLQDREAELQSAFEQRLASDSSSFQSQLASARKQLDEAISTKESLQHQLEQLEQNLLSTSKSRAMEDAATQMEKDGPLHPFVCSQCRTPGSQSYPQINKLTVNGMKPLELRVDELDHVVSQSQIPAAHDRPESSPPFDPENLARPSSWVEQLRHEIMQSKSIDSLHPAVRPGSFTHPALSQADYEALQLHNADLQNQLHQLSMEFEALRSSCKAGCGGSIPSQISPLLSPSVGSLHELVEYEYLKNVLFEYMLGRETSTLSKVLCSIMRFNADQTKRVMQHEDAKARSLTIETKLV